MDEKDFVERIVQERAQLDRAWVDEQSWLVRSQNNGRAMSSADVPEYIQPHGGGIAGFMRGYPIAGSFLALLLGGTALVIIWWLRMCYRNRGSNKRGTDTEERGWGTAVF